MVSYIRTWGLHCTPDRERDTFFEGRSQLHVNILTLKADNPCSQSVADLRLIRTYLNKMISLFPMSTLVFYLLWLTIRFFLFVLFLNGMVLFICPLSGPLGTAKEPAMFAVYQTISNGCVANEWYQWEQTQPKCVWSTYAQKLILHKANWSFIPLCIVLSAKVTCSPQRTLVKLHL